MPPLNVTLTLIPRRAPSLIDKSQPYISGIKRWGTGRLSSIASFWKDPFHTLLNLPW